MGNLQDKVSSLHIQDRVSSLQGRTKGLFSEFGNNAPRVLLLGLDGAGKTCLLYKAKLNSTMFANVPPIGINVEEMTPKRGATIAVWDMRGDKLYRHLWRNYYLKTEAIVFVVDSSDAVRLDEAQYELSQMLESRYLSKVPLVVAANKQDAEGALGPDEVAGLLELGEIQDRHWSVFGTNSKKGKGIKDVFREVVRLIKLTRKEKHLRKSELLKKHNDNLKQSKDTEIEIKVPPVNLDISDDSIKKHSLFENINKANTSSEDGNQNKGEKSDMCDTFFDDNTQHLNGKNQTLESIRKDNEDKGQEIETTHVIGDICYDPQTNNLKDLSNNVHDSNDTSNFNESNITDKMLSINNFPPPDDDKRSMSEVKVTDLDSDSDESSEDGSANGFDKEPDVCY